MISNKEFKSPSSIFRGAPFWSWNDKLEKKEIIRQIRDFKKVGLGGFFMHSRVGLITPYMGKEWMDIVKVSVAEAKKLGMKAYLYDEDRWPSGFAGGAVPLQSAEFRLKYLVCCEKEENISNQVFLKKEKIKGKDYYFYLRTMPLGSTWFNGTSYVDLLNPKTTDAFIKSTYEPYQKAFGKEFGKTIPAIFTDEPLSISSNIGIENFKYSMAWTGDFPEYFKKKMKYDILGHLPELFFKVKNYRKIRFDCRKVLIRKFVESFTKKIGNWCAKNKINFTGHFMSEDTFSSQMASNASMAHYEYMQWPGIDHLFWHIGERFPMHMTVKQVTSVSHQFHKERVLSELYGVGGWNLTFEGQKWVGDWEYVLGVNFRCQHLALYTLKGCRKRDYPPSINYQQRWWKHYNKVEDHFARLGYMLTRGTFSVNVLLLHSVSSGWAVSDFNDRKAMEYYFDMFLKTSLCLSELHYDYDYGDELIMERHGRVEGADFVVNKMRYKVVVMPGSLVWFKNTVDLLEIFVKNGGKLIAIKPLPEMIDGVKSNRIGRLFRHGNVQVIGGSKAELERALVKARKRDVSITDESGKEVSHIYYQHRIEGRKHIYFFANIDLKAGARVSIKFDIYGKVEEYDMETGSTMEIPLDAKFDFAPAQSRLLVLDTEKAPVVFFKKEWKVERTLALGNNWEFERLDSNALTLDCCRYKYREEKWSNSMPVWKAQLQIREKTGSYDGNELRHNRGIQFWKTLQEMKVKEHAKTVLKYNFNVKVVPKKAFLVVEIPERFDILVNGKPVKHDGKDWWVDKEFKRINISGLVKSGINEVELICAYREDIELESIYITGDFGVYGPGKNFYIGSEPKALKSGDWGRQGYSFYGGEMLYEQKVNFKKEPGEKILLKTEDINAVLVEVFVNGSSAGLLSWRPYELDITKFVKNGQNRIGLKVIASLRNLLGPHHVEVDQKALEGKKNITADMLGAGPGSFSNEKEWTDSYKFVKYGVLAKVSIVTYI